MIIVIWFHGLSKQVNRSKSGETDKKIQTEHNINFEDKTEIITKITIVTMDKVNV